MVQWFQSSREITFNPRQYLANYQLNMKDQGMNSGNQSLRNLLSHTYSSDINWGWTSAKKKNKTRKEEAMGYLKILELIQKS